VKFRKGYINTKKLGAASILRLAALTREPRELENSDFDETLHTGRGGGVNR